MWCQWYVLGQVGGRQGYFDRHKVGRRTIKYSVKVLWCMVFLAGVAMLLLCWV